MWFNPVLLVGILIQLVVTRLSRLAGAILGFVITTAMLGLGLYLYAGGNAVAILGFQLSLPLFLIAILLWYGYDTLGLLNVRREKQFLEELGNDPFIQSAAVAGFYRTTRQAWASGILASLGKAFEKESQLSQVDFIMKYPPTKGSILSIFFAKFQQSEGEFMISLGNQKSGDRTGWYLLTNQRLIQRDGEDVYNEIPLAEVDQFEISGRTLRKLVFTLKSGEQFSLEKLQMCPLEKYLSAAIQNQYSV